MKAKKLDFNKLLQKNFIILDGGFGTMLQSMGMKPGENPYDLNFTKPEWVKNVTRMYAQSGSDIVCSNTFGVNRYKLSDSRYSVQEVVFRAIEIAKEAVEGTNAYIALDIGPIGQLLEPTGTLTFEEAYSIFKELVLAGKEAGADAVIIATMTDLYEAKAALLAAKENCDLPVICNITFEKNGRTFTGCGVSEMVMTLESLSPDAIGVNCSLGPDDLEPVVKELLQCATVPVVIKPNAGLPDPITGKFNVDPKAFTNTMVKYASWGAKLLGGCCGTTPEYIKTLSEAVKPIPYNKPKVSYTSAFCSGTKTVYINQPRIIGERINPTGKKLFKQALINQDIDYILGQAIQQAEAGADMLDVNVGLPEIDEKQMMVRVVKALQGITDLPLQIDSTNPEVIEAALRVYNGKALVNSVNGEDESLNTILPIVKKYGAGVLGLTLDKNGIPKTARERVAIAEKIYKKAREFGIRHEDIYIDCLTLTASAQQEEVMETLYALKEVKERLGVKTVLGVSNVSFGLPNREQVTSTFLAMALTYGLDLPIMNPNIDSMTGTVRAFRLLAGYDKHSSEYIRAYQNKESKTAIAAPSEITLEYCILNGLKQEGAKLTEYMLKSHSPMDIVDHYLIPALDKTGKGFEEGTVFLPQLILAASSAQACFDVIKTHIQNSGTSPESKGKIILATVKGDVHDIGKNIVKVLLENYGYTIIDLGKDVSPEAILEAAVKHQVQLVGLSALMTTTLNAMADTIALLKEKTSCKVMVGGAVLTEGYAKQIGADYYGKDAKESVDIAKQVFGQ